MKKLILIATTLTVMLITGCETDATIAEANLIKEAESFNVYRKVSFYNALRDVVVLTVTGYCSFEAHKHKFDVLCKVDGKFLRHTMGRSDNTLPIVEHLEPSKVSSNHYKVIIRPQALIPDFDVKGDAGELIDAVTPD